MALFLAPPVLASEPPEKCAILLHGLLRGASSMNQIAEALREDGYFVVNEGYDSRSETIEALAENVLPTAIAACQNAPRIDFVTHSMGGIIVRVFLEQNELPALHRVVMLAPPNHGSEVVDEIGDWAIYEWIAGKSATELGTEASQGSIAKTVENVDFELGVIAGARSINPLFSILIPGVDDGAVALSRTAINGQKDYAILPVNHTFMTFNDKVIAETLAFLDTGAFTHQYDVKLDAEVNETAAEGAVVLQ